MNFKVPYKTEQRLPTKDEVAHDVRILEADINKLKTELAEKRRHMRALKAKKTQELTTLGSASPIVEQEYEDELTEYEHASEEIVHAPVEVPKSIFNPPAPPTAEASKRPRRTKAEMMAAAQALLEKNGRV